MAGKRDTLTAGVLMKLFDGQYALRDDAGRHWLLKIDAARTVGLEKRRVTIRGRTDGSHIRVEDIAEKLN